MTSQDERWELMAKCLAVHRQAMLEVARSHVTCSMAAEDVVQDAAIVALRRRGSLKHETAVRPWLLRITATVARKSIAKRARRSALRASHFAAPADPPAPSSEPDRRTDTIVDALESLPELQQRTVRCLLDGLSYRETAAKLDRTPGAVRMLRQRAVDNLRRMLRPPPPQAQPRH